MQQRTSSRHQSLLLPFAVSLWHKSRLLPYYWAPLGLNDIFWVFDFEYSTLMKVLRGEEMPGIGSGKSLKSGPDDNVFVFFSGHGQKGLLCSGVKILIVIITSRQQIWTRRSWICILIRNISTWSFTSNLAGRGPFSRYLAIRYR